MEKRIHYLMLVLAVLSIVYYILFFFGIFMIYNNPSTANEPGLKLNSKMIVSNLITPKIGDFVCFEHNDQTYDMGRYIKVNRLCALENDTLEIRNGIVYLNGINIDKDLNLVFFYSVDKEKFEKLKDEDLFTDEALIGQMSDGRFIINLENNIANKYGIDSLHMLEKKGKVDDQILKVYKQNWNKDNFGPLIIPKNKFFVLGDNRDNSLDSRYIGLQDNRDLKGVVLRKNDLKKKLPL